MKDHPPTHKTMEEEVTGAIGTSASLALRLGQTIFSAISLLFMGLHAEFYSYSSFCFLVTIIGLMIPWSITMLLIDAYSVFLKPLNPGRRIVLIVFIGDGVLQLLSLAAAASTASVTTYLHEAGQAYFPVEICRRYQLSAATAFFAWFLSFASTLLNFWLLATL